MHATSTPAICHTEEPSVPVLCDTTLSGTRLALALRRSSAAALWRSGAGHVMIGFE
jgi:hypothetical protein